MKKLMTAMILLTLAQSALALHPSGLTATSQTTTARAIVGDKELTMFEARDEAANFINTRGRVRGPQLEKALRMIRTQNPDLRQSDLELAQDILDMDFNQVP